MADTTNNNSMGSKGLFDSLGLASNRQTYTSNTSTTSIGSSLLPGDSIRSMSNPTNNSNLSTGGIESIGSNSVVNSKYSRQEYAETFGQSFSGVGSAIDSMGKKIATAIEDQTNRLLEKGFGGVVETINNNIAKPLSQLLEYQRAFAEEEQSLGKKIEEYRAALDKGLTGIAIDRVKGLIGQVLTPPDIEGLKKTVTSYIFENFTTISRIFGVDTRPNNVDTWQKPVAFTLETRNAIIHSTKLLENIEYYTNKTQYILHQGIKTLTNPKSDVVKAKSEEVHQTTEFRNRILEQVEESNLALQDIADKLTKIGASIVLRNEQDVNLYKNDLLIKLSENQSKKANVTNDDEKKRLDRQHQHLMDSLSSLSGMKKAIEQKNNKSLVVFNKDNAITGMLSDIKNAFMSPEKKLAKSTFKVNDFKKLEDKGVKTMEALIKGLQKNTESTEKLTKSTMDMSDRYRQDTPSKLINVVSKLGEIISEPLNVFRGLGSALFFFAKWGGLYKAADWLIGKGREGINYVSDIGLGTTSEGQKRTIGSVTSGLWTGLTTFVDPVITGIRNIFKDFIGEDTYNKITEVLSSTKEWVSNLWTGLFGPEKEREAAREKLFEPLKLAISKITSEMLLPALYRGYTVYTGTKALLNPVDTFNRIRSFGNAEKLADLQNMRVARTYARTLTLQGIRKSDYMGIGDDPDKIAAFSRKYNIGDQAIAGNTIAILNKNMRTGPISTLFRGVNGIMSFGGKVLSFIPVIGQVFALAQSFVWLQQGISKFRDWFKKTDAEEGGFSGFIKKTITSFFSTATSSFAEFLPIAIKATTETAKAIVTGTLSFLKTEGIKFLSNIADGFMYMWKNGLDFMMDTIVFAFSNLPLIGRLFKSGKIDAQSSDYVDPNKPIEAEEKAWYQSKWAKMAGGVALLTASAFTGGIPAFIAGAIGSTLVGSGTKDIAKENFGASEDTANLIGNIAGIASGGLAAGGNILYHGGKKVVEEGVKKGAEVGLKEGAKTFLSSHFSKAALKEGVKSTGKAMLAHPYKTAGVAAALGGAYNLYKTNGENKRIIEENPWLLGGRGALFTSLGQDMYNNMSFTDFSKKLSSYEEEFNEAIKIGKEKNYDIETLTSLENGLKTLKLLSENKDYYGKLQSWIKSGQSITLGGLTSNRFNLNKEDDVWTQALQVFNSIKKDIENKRAEDRKKLEEEKQRENEEKENANKEEMKGGPASLGQLSQWIQNGTAKRWLKEQFTSLGDSIKGAWTFLKTQDYKKMFGSAMEVFGGVTGNIMSTIFGEEKADAWLRAAYKHAEKNGHELSKRFFGSARTSLLSDVKNLAQFALKTNTTLEEIRDDLRKYYSESHADESPQQQDENFTKYWEGLKGTTEWDKTIASKLSGMTGYSSEHDFKLGKYNSTLRENEIKTVNSTRNSVAGMLKQNNVSLYDKEGNIQLPQKNSEMLIGSAITRTVEGAGTNEQERIDGAPGNDWWSRRGIYAAKLPTYYDSMGPSMKKIMMEQYYSKFFNGNIDKKPVLTKGAKLDALNRILKSDNFINDVNLQAKVYESYFKEFKDYPFPVNVILTDHKYQYGAGDPNGKKGMISTITRAARVLGNPNIQLNDRAGALRTINEAAKKDPWYTGSIILSAMLRRSITNTEKQVRGIAYRVYKIAGALGYSRAGEIFKHPNFSKAAQQATSGNGTPTTPGENPVTNPGPNTPNSPNNPELAKTGIKIGQKPAATAGGSDVNIPSSSDKPLAASPGISIDSANKITVSPNTIQLASQDNTADRLGYKPTMDTQGITAPGLASPASNLYISPEVINTATKDPAPQKEVNKLSDSTKSLISSYSEQSLTTTGGRGAFLFSTLKDQNKFKAQATRLSNNGLTDARIEELMSLTKFDKQKDLDDLVYYKDVVDKLRLIAEGIQDANMKRAALSELNEHAQNINLVINNAKTGGGVSVKKAQARLVANATKKGKNN